MPYSNKSLREDAIKEKNMNSNKIGEIQSALIESWSLETSTKWKKSNPALGQCGVTALIAQDMLGGEILKTRVVKAPHIDIWHYYNNIGGRIIDFTETQFDEPITYDIVPSTREEAFTDTNQEQYNCLRRGVGEFLKRK